MMNKSGGRILDAAKQIEEVSRVKAIIEEWLRNDVPEEAKSALAPSVCDKLVERLTGAKVSRTWQ